MHRGSQLSIPKFALAAIGTLAIFGSALAQPAPVPGRGTWETTLQPRDLDGDNVPDGLDDTHLNITWLRDEPLAGLMDWQSAMDWAGALKVGNYDDWRLPNTDTCVAFGCYENELGHLWHVELGNTDTQENPGPFTNLWTQFLWTGSTYLPDPNQAWYYVMKDGYQYHESKQEMRYLYAVAVHPGDIGRPVPESGTLALLLAGLATLAVHRCSARLVAGLPGCRPI